MTEHAKHESSGVEIVKVVKEKIAELSAGS